MSTNDTVERTVYSARFPRSLYRWMRDEVEGTNSSLNEFLAQLAEDVRDFYGLPAVMRAALTADQKALRLSHREYMMHLLTRRYEQLLNRQAGFDADPKAPGSARPKERHGKK